MVRNHVRQLARLSGLLLLLHQPVSAAEVQFEHVLTIGSEGRAGGQFSYVEDFAFAADGSLLVTDAGHAYVQAFDPTTGRFLGRFGGKGDTDSNLDKPEGIAVGPNGDVFVADYNTGFIKKYDREFRYLATFSEYGSEKGQTIRSEFADIYDGKLYVPEAGNNRVSVFDLNGSFLFDFGRGGTGPGELNVPESAKADSHGRLFVADLKNNRIQVFNPEGRFLFGWGGHGSGAGQFSAPAGIAVDSRDNVYVTEIGNDRVQVFDCNGAFIMSFGQKGSGAGEFKNLHGIIVDKKTGWLYVADTGNNRVQVFRPRPKPAS